MFHDASVSVIEDGNILFAGHSERYSREKNDAYLNQELVNEALAWGKPDVIVLHESSKLKKQRRLSQLSWSSIKSAFTEPTAEDWIKKFYPQLAGIPITNCLHHQSHAAAGMLTVPEDWNDAAIVTIDAIGEKQTATISTWQKNERIMLRHEVNFPNSLGLFYSAVTSAVGLKPMEDEYILMGMAGWSDWNTTSDKLYEEIDKYFFAEPTGIKMNHNLHRGCMNWDSEYYKDDGSDEWKFKIASVVQKICEKRIMDIFDLANRLMPGCNNYVYGGGVALNCVANSLIAREYPNVWIIPNPGDGGSSLGSAAFVLGRHLDWNNCFLGYDIKGDYPIEQTLKELLDGNIVGVASGRAEFGPRALGNRSLLADPRGHYVKDLVNAIKKRQEFRPFAPAVLEEHAHEIFDMPVRKSQYMQFVAPCKYPDLYPAICHVDNTSRVQTVSKEDNPNFYRLINEFYKKTGCPMLLNTSLNIKGMPIVNTREDGVAFEKKYGVKVYG